MATVHTWLPPYHPSFVVDDVCVDVWMESSCYLFSLSLILGLCLRLLGLGLLGLGLLGLLGLLDLGLLGLGLLPHPIVNAVLNRGICILMVQDCHSRFKSPVKITAPHVRLCFYPLELFEAPFFIVVVPGKVISLVRIWVISPIQYGVN